MEFKFRAVDERPPNCFPAHSSSFNTVSGQGFRSNPNFTRNRPDLVQWELEKVRIREEMIASEIARRRALEAEVRRELMAEWEMAAMRRARETSLSYEQRLTMLLDSRLPFMHHFDNHNRWRPEARFNSFPLPPVSEVLDTEVKNTSEGNKNKLIILAKPDPNRVVGVKRKTLPLAGTGELPLNLITSKVKQHEEWSCAICQVSATSEKGLAEHLQGRKHKANEAKLRAQRMEKDSYTNTITLPKKLRQSDQKLEDKEKLKNKKDELMIERKEKAERFRKKKRADSLEKKHEPTAMDEVEITLEHSKKKKYKFWCEICMVGVNSKVVMETHKKGRRHIARLLELNKNDVAAPATTTTNTVTEQARPNDTHMPRVTDVVSDEASDKLMDVPRGW